MPIELKSYKEGAGFRVQEPSPPQVSLTEGVASTTHSLDVGEWMPDLMQGVSPASYLADLTGWGDFDSGVFCINGFWSFGSPFPGFLRCFL